MLAAPHLPLAVVPRAGPAPAIRVAEPAGPHTGWLRAPEHAATLGEARALGEATEAARILGQALRAGAVTGEDGTRLTRARLLHAGAAGALRWLAGELTRPGEARSTAILVVHGEGVDAVAAEERVAGVADRSRWIAFGKAPPGRWRAHISLPFWVSSAGLATSPVGVLLAEWRGLDSVRMLAGAREVDGWCAEPDAARNPAAWLAADLDRPVALAVGRADLRPAAEWASEAAAERGRVVLPFDGTPAAGWGGWWLGGPEVRPGALGILVDPDDPAAAGAWCALVERALDLADLAGRPPWYGRPAEAP